MFLAAADAEWEAEATLESSAGDLAVVVEESPTEHFLGHHHTNVWLIQMQVISSHFAVPSLECGADYVDERRVGA